MNYEEFKAQSVQAFLKNPLWRERCEGRDAKTIKDYWEADFAYSWASLNAN